jgi:hypothetical protein
MPSPTLPPGGAGRHRIAGAVLAALVLVAALAYAARRGTGAVRIPPAPDPLYRLRATGRGGAR